jgi:hypothetical protein
VKSTIAVCVTALLIFGIWFGWQRYAEHKRAIEKEQRERWEGYERCITPLNEIYGRPGTRTPEETATDQKARASCRDFWLRDTREVVKEQKLKEQK